MPQARNIHVNIPLLRCRRAVAAFFLLLAAVFLSASPGRAIGAEDAGAKVVPGAGGDMAVPAAPQEAKPDWMEQDWKDRVVAIPVKGAIVGKPFSTMAETLEKALEKAEKDGAARVVLEIDSPGGEVGVCDKLSKRIFEMKTPVVSLVLHKAVSGAAMLASAAPEIIMTKAARIGDIQPMQMSLTGQAPTMDDRTAEKIEVDIRTIMKVYAHHYGRPAAVFEAMVSRSSALYEVEFREGDKEYLTNHELEVVEKNIDLDRDTRHITNTTLIKPDGKLLELSAPQAVQYGVASDAVDSAAQFYASQGIDEADVLRPHIEEGSIDLKKLIPKLSDLGLPVWVVVLLGVFLVVGIAGFVTEYHAPGSGIPAAIGVIGFVCFFATLLMHDRGSPLGIALFLIGIGLLVVEIMVLPGFGVAGILGILGVLGGLLLAFTPDWRSEYMHQFMWHEVGAFVLLMVVGLVAAVAVIIIISQYGERLPYLGRFFLKETQPAGVNPYAETLAPEETRESERLKLVSLKGRKGVAESMLRPAGKVRLDSGELLDVITDGVYIEAGTRVVVTEAAPNRIVVGIER